MSQKEFDAAIAEFIRTKGTTRAVRLPALIRPTALSLPLTGQHSKRMRWNANSYAGVKLRYAPDHFGPSGEFDR